MVAAADGQRELVMIRVIGLIRQLSKPVIISRAYSSARVLENLALGSYQLTDSREQRLRLYTCLARHARHATIGIRIGRKGSQFDSASGRCDTDMSAVSAGV